MGGAPSTPQKLTDKEKKMTLKKTQQEVVKLMMPVYYTPETIDATERKYAVDSWNLIVTARSPEYLAQKSSPDFQYGSCITFFYDSFYKRLFDIHPMCRQLFRKGMQSQGTFLVKMISLSLSELEDPNKFDKTLIKLAEVHFQRGVKAIEYGIVGEVLFWVLQHVLGPTVYTPQLQQAWLKIYCRMIRTIIPVAVALELHQGPAQQQSNRSNNSQYAVSMMNSQDKQALSQLQHEAEEEEVVVVEQGGAGTGVGTKESLQCEMVREGECTKAHHSKGRHVLSQN